MTSLEQAKLTIRKDDQVQVIAGREKGKTGKVLKVDGKNGRILVEKINVVKRHVKPSQKYPAGGIIEKETPIHYSNVLLFCPKCNRGVRHGIKAGEVTASKKTKGAKAAVASGAKLKKIRICKKCGESLDQA